MVAMIVRAVEAMEAAHAEAGALTAGCAISQRSSEPFEASIIARVDTISIFHLSTALPETTLFNVDDAPQPLQLRAVTSAA